MATKAAPAIGNQETQIQRAIAALENGECESIHSAAKEFEVSCSTLQGHITRNCQTWHESHEHEQHLSNTEEQRIVKACLHMDNIGLSITVNSVHQYVESIYCACKKLKSVWFGTNWSSCFFEQHPELKTMYA